MIKIEVSHRCSIFFVLVEVVLMEKRTAFQCIIEIQALLQCYLHD